MASEVEFSDIAEWYARDLVGCSDARNVEREAYAEEREARALEREILCRERPPVPNLRDLLVSVDVTIAMCDAILRFRPAGSSEATVATEVKTAATQSAEEIRAALYPQIDQTAAKTGKK